MKNFTGQRNFLPAKRLLPYPLFSLLPETLGFKRKVYLETGGSSTSSPCHHTQVDTLGRAEKAREWWGPEREAGAGSGAEEGTLMGRSLLVHYGTMGERGGGVASGRTPRSRHCCLATRKLE